MRRLGSSSPPRNAAAVLFALGLVADFDATRISGVADGAALSSWADSRGNYTATQATGGLRPTYQATAWSDGGPCVSFTRSSNTHMRVDTLGAAVADQARAYTVAALVRRASAGTDQALLSFCGSNSTNTRPLHQTPYFSSANVGASWIATLANNAKFINGAAVATTEDTLVVAVINGANSAVYVNGQLVTGDMTQASDTPFTAAAIGTAIVAGSPANSFDGKLRRLLVWNRALTRRDVHALHAMLGVQSLLRHRIVCDGNSLTAGQGGTPYPSQLTLPSSTLQVVNLGVGGQQTTDMITNFMANVAPYYHPTDEPLLLFAWEVTNAIYYGATDVTAVAQFWTYCDMARALGSNIRVVAAAPITRGNFTNQAQMEAYRASAAVLMANQWRAHADAFIDLTTSPELSNFNDTTYFNADKCHLTAAGYAVVAARMQAVVQALALGKSATSYWLT